MQILESLQQLIEGSGRLLQQFKSHRLDGQSAAPVARYPHN